MHSDKHTDARAAHGRLGLEENARWTEAQLINAVPDTCDLSGINNVSGRQNHPETTARACDLVSEAAHSHPPEEVGKLASRQRCRMLERRR